MKALLKSRVSLIITSIRTRYKRVGPSSFELALVLCTSYAVCVPSTAVCHSVPEAFPDHPGPVLPWLSLTAVCANLDARCRRTLLFCLLVILIWWSPTTAPYTGAQLSKGSGGGRVEIGLARRATDAPMCFKSRFHEFIRCQASFARPVWGDSEPELWNVTMFVESCDFIIIIIRMIIEFYSAAPFLTHVNTLQVKQ